MSSILTATPVPVVTVTATVTAAAVTVTPSIMPYMTSPTSINATIGMFQVIIGLQVILIVGFSAMALIPILSSLGLALGCGLSHYMWYTNYSADARSRASVFADLGWGLQEMMLPLYSFFIVRKVLETGSKTRVVFHVVFAFMLFGTFCLRLAMIPLRVQNVKQTAKTGLASDEAIQEKLNGLTMAYFCTIAFNEGWCASFLIKKFHEANARRESITSGQPKMNLYKKLALSTEIRLVFITIIGVSRAVLFSFQVAAQSADTVTSQMDRFMGVFEAQIPVVFYIDLLASKLIFQKRFVPAVESPSRHWSWKDTVRDWREKTRRGSSKPNVSWDVLCKAMDLADDSANKSRPDLEKMRTISV